MILLHNSGFSCHLIFFTVNPSLPVKSLLLLLSALLNLFIRLSIQTGLWSHTVGVLSSPYCCHSQWHATIWGCERDPAHCVSGIFSPNDSLELQSYTCSSRPFGFLIEVTIAEEEISGQVQLLCADLLSINIWAGHFLTVPFLCPPQVTYFCGFIICIILKPVLEFALIPVPRSITWCFLSQLLLNSKHKWILEKVDWSFSGKKVGSSISAPCSLHV